MPGAHSKETGVVTLLVTALLSVAVACAIAGCGQSIEDLNSKAKQPSKYDSPRALYDAMTKAGVKTVAFVSSGAAPGPGGGTMYRSGEVNFGDRSATILVFPASAIQKKTMDFYVKSWLSSAKSSGVEDPTVLRGANWLLTGGGDLSGAQEALGGQLKK